MKGISKYSPVTLVELPPTEFGILNGTPSAEMYSGFRAPSRSIPALEAVLRYDRWKDVQSINPLFHGEDGRLTPSNIGRIFQSDVLGVSSITRTALQSMELITIYKSVNPEGIVIAGGMDPTYRTEEWLKVGADIVVRGEGERTLSELMNRLEQGHDLDDVKSITFQRDKNITVTGPRSPLTSEELSQLPHPFYDPQTRANVNAAVMETSRGCPNRCDHCGVSLFYGAKYRRKSTEYIIAGLKDIQDLKKPIFFTDDNFALRPADTLPLLEAIAEYNLIRQGSSAQVTIKAAENDKFLEALERANISTLYVGIESLFDDSLRDFGKQWSAKRNKDAIVKYREAGFIVHGMLMPGGDKDTPERLEETSAWINENLDTVQLFAPGPVPGSKLAETMRQQGRILTEDYSLYSGEHVIVRPNNFTPLELQQTIHRMYDSFYSKEPAKRDLPPKKRAARKVFHRLISNAIRAAIASPQMKKHLEFLERVS